MTPEIAATIRESFARQSLMATLGAELTEVSVGRVVIEAPVADHVLQQHGYAHAGLTFAIGDSAAGYAALSRMPDGAEVNTVEMKINLMRPAAGERLIAEGYVVRAGRRLVVVEARVFAVTGESRKECARLLGTMIPL